MLNAHGFDVELLICSIHPSSSSVVLAFGPGKDPTNPALLLAITNSGPETKNIGATITGNLNLFISLLFCIRVIKNSNQSLLQLRYIYLPKP